MGNVESMIKKAAIINNDLDMQKLVTDENLREREFQLHDKCYRDYTKGCRYTESDTVASISSESRESENEGNPDRFADVVLFVKTSVIGSGRTCSMEVLTEIFGKDPKDREHRRQLKDKLLKEFEDELLFLDVTYHLPQIVMHKSCVNNNTILSHMKENKRYAITEAARFIRVEILEMIEKAPSLTWPPKAKDLLEATRQPPELMNAFLRCLFHDSHHTESDKVQDYVWSYSQDMVHGVSRGRFLTAKGNALHSMTGQKKPIQILSKLGDSCSYHTVQLIKTGQAELVQKMREENIPLPIVPSAEDKTVLIHFWWDNFDCKKENTAGGVHTTHGIAF